MAATLRIEVTRSFERPVDVVFRALTDERESPHWRGVTAAEYDVGGPCVIGAKFWRADGGRRAAFEVTSCEPYAAYTTASDDGRTVEAIGCRSLDPLTTRVELVVERSLTGALVPLRRLVGWVAHRRLARQLAAAAAWLEPTRSVGDARADSG